MRNLTAKQKKLLNEYARSQGYKATSWEPANDLPAKLYDELVRLNDTEILWQNINMYLLDLENEKNS